LHPRDDHEYHELEKRAYDPCVPQDYSNRPTATLYTTTDFSTTTVSFTSTETDTSTSTTTITVGASTPTFIVSGTFCGEPADNSHCDQYSYTTTTRDHQNYKAPQVNHHYHKDNHGYQERSWWRLST